MLPSLIYLDWAKHSNTPASVAHASSPKQNGFGEQHYHSLTHHTRDITLRRFQHTPRKHTPDPKKPSVYERNPFILDFFHIWGMFQGSVGIFLELHMLPPERNVLLP